MSESVHGMVDHLFRRSAGRMVATLTRILGAEHLSLAEEVVQDALVSALQNWSIRGFSPQTSWRLIGPPPEWRGRHRSNCITLTSIDKTGRVTIWHGREYQQNIKS